MAQAEFISAEHFYQNGAPTQAACVGSCGGPSKEAVMQQIEGFVAERTGEVAGDFCPRQRRAHLGQQRSRLAHCGSRENAVQ